MEVPRSARERPGALVLALAQAWRARTPQGPGEPVVFWRGDEGTHRAWPADVPRMTRTEADELARLDLVRTAHPASEVTMVSPTRRALELEPLLRAEPATAG